MLQQEEILIVLKNVQFELIPSSRAAITKLMPLSLKGQIYHLNAMILLKVD